MFLFEDNSLFAGFNSLLGGKNSRLGLLREFACNTLVLLAVFLDNQRRERENRKNSLFSGKYREFADRRYSAAPGCSAGRGRWESPCPWLVMNWRGAGRPSAVGRRAGRIASPICGGSSTRSLQPPRSRAMFA